MFRVIFKIENGQDVKVDAENGENLLELAVNNGVIIDAPCSGNGTCGKCRLSLISGTVDTTRTPTLSDSDYNDGIRLACQSRVCGDCTVWVPASASAFKTGIKTADLSSPEELENYNNSIADIFSTELSYGVEEKGYGIAVDIGTTTVTAAMLDLETRKVLSKASRGNGQIRYGADVINRILAQSRPGGRERLIKAVREDTLLPIIDSLLQDAGIGAEQISRYVIAGNTTMEHLLLGADGNTIRCEPYEPEFLEIHDLTAGKVGLPGREDVPVIFAPNVGSYVGGDITAGTLDTLLWNNEEMTLFIDLGTNGELVFGNADFMLTCACSAGPAFEGGDISCGMRATTGAVDSIVIDAETMEPTLSVIGDSKPAGLCGSGLIDTISELFKAKIIDSRGKIVREGKRIKHYDDINAYVIAFAEDSAGGRDVELNEIDIDNFIRAKGAIFSAIRSMLNSLDMTVDCIDKVLIAGGIGSGINIENAISIGMLPKIELEKYRYIGNSSLVGACAMLVSDDAEQKVFELSSNMTYLELSTHPGYMDEFVASCFIPHTDFSLFE